MVNDPRGTDFNTIYNDAQVSKDEQLEILSIQYESIKNKQRDPIWNIRPQKIWELTNGDETTFNTPPLK